MSRTTIPDRQLGADLAVCRHGFVLLCAVSCVPTISLGQVGSVAFRPDAGRVEIRVGEETVATYVYRDAKIPRPYLAHVRGPGGVQLTRNHPPVEGQDATDHPEI